MWNNYRTPTERWQKTSDSQKARNSPRTWVGQKEKEKPEIKEEGWGQQLWEGAVKEEKFPYTRKPLHWWRWGVAGGKLQSQEESAATGVQRAKQKDSLTEDQYRPALTSPRGLSAHPLGQVGAGSWGSGFGGQTTGRGLGLAARTQPEGG